MFLPGIPLVILAESAARATLTELRSHLGSWRVPISFPFRQRASLTDCARQLQLNTYVPSISLHGLMTGVDNLRHDVYLSPRFAQVTRTHFARLIAKYGSVEDICAEDTLKIGQPPSVLQRFDPKQSRSTDAPDFKQCLTDLQVAGLNRAKAEDSVSIDLLSRLAIIKFLRAELNFQFDSVLERCRARAKSYESARHAHPRALEYRERTAGYQVNRKLILRKVGQEIFLTLRDVEKETVARTRRSLLRDGENPGYELLLNRLLFVKDGRDDYLNAEHYVMLGNYERDPDRFDLMLGICSNFLHSLGFGDEDSPVDGYLSVPENGYELVGGGSPEASSPKYKAQSTLLDAWLTALEDEGVMDHVVASYEAVGLLPEYSPPINPQQLKNALVSRTELRRVEHLLEEQGKLSVANLQAAVKRVAACRGEDRGRMAGRFLVDFMRLHRDVRRMDAVDSALDTINVIANERLRELSAINNTLYEFLLVEEQKPTGEKITHHVIIKADIRDSTTLTRTLFERGLNPASYFSLNFYEPVNKLLPKYEATKVFIEGDAVILALFEREGEPGMCVARSCVLAKEMIDIVRGYNEHSQKSGLPTLELGIGISYQDSAPMYLMDGTTQIMISKALNESDRLSSCSKNARKMFGGLEGAFNVYCYQTIGDADAAGLPEEFLIRYNIGGITISEEAFAKLRQEISLQAADVALPNLWSEPTVRLYRGMVPVAQGVFHNLVIREAKIPHIAPRGFRFVEWTQRYYYEVCTSPAIYEYFEVEQAAAAGH
jgi:hypothetical protein